MFTRKELLEMLDSIREAFCGEVLVDRDVADTLARKLHMHARLRTVAEQGAFLTNLAQQITRHLHDTSPYVQQLQRFVDFVTNEIEDPDGTVTLEELGELFEEFEAEEEEEPLMLRMFLQQSLQHVSVSSEIGYMGIMHLLCTYEDMATMAS